jgi:hypothetical protein
VICGPLPCPDTENVVTCEVVAKPPDLCDGRDNDGDGAVDEDYAAWLKTLPLGGKCRLPEDVVDLGWPISKVPAPLPAQWTGRTYCYTECDGSAHEVCAPAGLDRVCRRCGTGPQHRCAPPSADCDGTSGYYGWPEALRQCLRPIPGMPFPGANLGALACLPGCDGHFHETCKLPGEAVVCNPCAGPRDDLLECRPAGQ